MLLLPRYLNVGLDVFTRGKLTRLRRWLWKTTTPCLPDRFVQFVSALAIVCEGCSHLQPHSESSGGQIRDLPSGGLVFG